MGGFDGGWRRVFVFFSGSFHCFLRTLLLVIPGKGRGVCLFSPEWMGLVVLLCLLRARIRILVGLKGKEVRVRLVRPFHHQISIVVICEEVSKILARSRLVVPLASFLISNRERAVDSNTLGLLKWSSVVSGRQAAICKVPLPSTSSRSCSTRISR
jgi:hypothetical protein